MSIPDGIHSYEGTMRKWATVAVLTGKAGYWYNFVIMRPVIQPVTSHTQSKCTISGHSFCRISFFIFTSRSICSLLYDYCILLSMSYLPCSLSSTFLLSSREVNGENGYALYSDSPRMKLCTVAALPSIDFNKG